MSSLIHTKHRRTAGEARMPAAIVALILLGLTTHASAVQQPPAGAVLPDLDARSATLAPPAPPRQAALSAVAALEQATAARCSVKWDPAGRVRWLHAQGQPLSGVSQGSAESIARAFLAAQPGLCGLSAGEASVLELSFVEEAGSGLTHVGFEQLIEGLPVFHGHLRVDLMDGRVVALGTADSRPGFRGSAQPTLSASAAAARAARAAGLGEVYFGEASPDPSAGTGAVVFQVAESPDPIPARLIWFPTRDAARLAWQLRVTPPGGMASYEILVDAESGETLFRSNRVLYADTRAEVFAESPDHGPRSVEIVFDTEVNVDADWPAGWIDADTTAGNNVIARDDRAGDNELSLGLMPTVTPGSPRLFDPPYTDDVLADLDLSVVNLYWQLNRAHEHFYGLGFTESAGNFQQDNFGRGGLGGDAILADAQDSADLGVRNNANWSFSVDGQSPRTQYFLWDLAPTLRASDLDGSIVFHEFCHGLSTRLVGGRSTSSCVSGVQSGAMGEGWGDYFAASYFDEPVVGAHSSGSPGGIRTARMDADTYTYGDLCAVAGFSCQSTLR